MDSKIRINCREIILELEPTSLRHCEDTALEAMFSGRHQVDLKDDLPFIDRDPLIF